MRVDQSDQGTGTIPCRSPENPENWWVEDDLDASTPRARHQQAQWDLLRGQLHCWAECPLLAECAEAGMDEKYHVWGGLQPAERDMARKQGEVGPFPETVAAVRQDAVQLRTRATAMFLEGVDVPEIAVSLGRSENVIVAHLRGSLAQVRRTREDKEPWLFQKQQSQQEVTPLTSTPSGRGQTSKSPTSLAS